MYKFNQWQEECNDWLKKNHRIWLLFIQTILLWTMARFKGMAHTVKILIEICCSCWPRKSFRHEVRGEVTKILNSPPPPTLVVVMGSPMLMNPPPVNKRSPSHSLFYWASFCLLSVFSTTTFQNSCKLPRDWNTNRQSKRQACWPLVPHHHRAFQLYYEVSSPLQCNRWGWLPYCDLSSQKRNLCSTTHLPKALPNENVDFYNYFKFRWSSQHSCRR